MTVFRPLKTELVKLLPPVPLREKKPICVNSWFLSVCKALNKEFNHACPIYASDIQVLLYVATAVICQQWKDNILAFSLSTPREVLTNRNLSSFCSCVKTVEAIVLYCFPWPYICLYDVYYWLK